MVREVGIRVDTKRKALLVMVCFFLFLIGVAFFVGTFKGPITGAVVADGCFVQCHNNSECDDHNPCTLDGCAYPSSCGARCVYVEKEGCKY